MDIILSKNLHFNNVQMQNSQDLVSGKVKGFFFKGGVCGVVTTGELSDSEKNQLIDDLRALDSIKVVNKPDTPRRRIKARLKTIQADIDAGEYAKALSSFLYIMNQLYAD